MDLQIIIIALSVLSLASKSEILDPSDDVYMIAKQVDTIVNPTRRYGINLTDIHLESIKHVLDDHNVTIDWANMYLNNAQSLKCLFCHQVLELIGKDIENIVFLINYGCKISSLSEGLKSSYCLELANNYREILKKFVRDDRIRDHNYICSVLTSTPCDDGPEANWLEYLPEPEQELDYQNPVFKSSNNHKETKPLKILQLTDLHISEEYTIGGEVNCGLPVCCQKKASAFAAKEAGLWGDYRYCDIPDYFFLETLKYINKTHKDIDYIYFTGDIIDHSVWKASIQNTSLMVKYALNVFRHMKKPFFPVIGNHEGVPINSYAPDYLESKFSSQWLYEIFAKYASIYLPDEAFKDFRKFGYYSVKLRKNFRLIVLHNAVAYHLNPWVIYDPYLFKRQLKWLIETLQNAEDRGEFVHILGHVPPGDELISTWNTNYYNIIQRYAAIIKGQFFGHTHTDDWTLFLNKTNDEPFSIAFNGGSLTPYTELNPNFKIYTVDPDNYEILDADSYYVDLQESNKFKCLKWKKLYSMKENFQLDNLNATSVYKKVKTMYNDEILFREYYKINVKNAKPSMEKPCNWECRTKMLCHITATCQ